MPFENKLVLIDPSGRILVSYLKSHAVPGWEAGIMRLGDSRVPVMATSDGRFATVVCFDADFPEFIRQAAQGSADLLILPVNDWKEVKVGALVMALGIAAVAPGKTGAPVSRLRPLPGRASANAQPTH